MVWYEEEEEEKERQGRGEGGEGDRVVLSKRILRLTLFSHNKYVFLKPEWDCRFNIPPHLSVPHRVRHHHENIATCV